MGQCLHLPPAKLVDLSIRRPELRPASPNTPHRARVEISAVIEPAKVMMSPVLIWISSHKAFVFTTQIDLSASSSSAGR
jgi:hypothetical protein